VKGGGTEKRRGRESDIRGVGSNYRVEMKNYNSRTLGIQEGERHQRSWKIEGVEKGSAEPIPQRKLTKKENPT